MLVVNDAETWCSEVGGAGLRRAARIRVSGRRRGRQGRVGQCQLCAGDVGGLRRATIVLGLYRRRYWSRAPETLQQHTFTASHLVVAPVHGHPPISHTSPTRLPHRLCSCPRPRASPAPCVRRRRCRCCLCSHPRSRWCAASNCCDASCCCDAGHRHAECHAPHVRQQRRWRWQWW